MADPDLKSLRNLLRRLASGRSSEVLEEAMGVGHGRLGRLLDGSMELRVRHLIGLARFLHVAPSELVKQGCPAAEEAAVRRLAEWIGPAEPPFAEKSGQPLAADLEARMREIAREEIAAESARRSRS